MADQDKTPVVTVERPEQLGPADLLDLSDAAETAILDGGGFGWLLPPPREVMDRYWRGVLLISERTLFVGRLDGRIGGSAQLVRPPRHNEAQSRIATITINFVAPWARGHGMARQLTLACEKAARDFKMDYINLDVRETQQAAIRLYESLDYECWGTNPNYATVDGKLVAGRYYTKALRRRRRKRAPRKAPGA